MKFFTVHREADLHHAGAVARMIERHGGSGQDNPMMLESGRAALKAVWNMLDCV